jgi:hypothetical protein
MKKVIIALAVVLMTAMVVSCHTPHEGVPDEDTVNIEH